MKLEFLPLAIYILTAPSLVEDTRLTKPQASIAGIRVLGFRTPDLQRETCLTCFEQWQWRVSVV